MTLIHHRAYVYTDASFYRKKKIGTFAFIIKIINANGTIVFSDERSGVFKNPVETNQECEMLCVANACYSLLKIGRDLYLDKVFFVTDSARYIEDQISKEDKYLDPKQLKLKKLLLTISMVNGLRNKVYKFVDVKSKSRDKKEICNTHDQSMNLIVDKMCKLEMSKIHVRNGR